MTSKERVRKAVRFGNPDKPPMDCWVLPAAFMKYGNDLSSLLARYPKDFADVAPAEDGFFVAPNYRKGDYTDFFGCVWRQEHAGMIGQVVKHPIQNAEDARTHKFPRPDETEDGVSFKQIKETLRKRESEEKYYAADFVRTFERMHFMRGMEELMMDMAYGRDEFSVLLQRVAKWNMEHLHALFEVLEDEIDGVWFSDDWGAQNSLLISPASWRKHFKPVYERMIRFVKQRGKDVFFHSDGYIVDIIEGFIEIGVDAVNCQIGLMGPGLLADRFGGRVAFHTDLDRQNVLPFGAPDEIRNQIQDFVKHLGRFPGGLILCAELGPDMPFENIVAVVEEFDLIRNK